MNTERIVEKIFLGCRGVDEVDDVAQGEENEVQGGVGLYFVYYTDAGVVYLAMRANYTDISRVFEVFVWFLDCIVLHCDGLTVLNI